VKKQIIIATISLCNIAWTMEEQKHRITSQSTSTVLSKGTMSNTIESFSITDDSRDSLKHMLNKSTKRIVPQPEPLINTDQTLFIVTSAHTRQQLIAKL
jgi:hypothetical protein